MGTVHCWILLTIDLDIVTFTLKIWSGPLLSSEANLVWSFDPCPWYYELHIDKFVWAIALKLLCMATASYFQVISSFWPFDRCSWNYDIWLWNCPAEEYSVSMLYFSSTLFITEKFQNKMLCPTARWVLLYLGMVGSAVMTPIFLNFQSDWILIFSSTQFDWSPLSAEKNWFVSIPLVPEILGPKVGLVFHQNVLFNKF